MAVDPQRRKLAARIRKLERQALQRKQPSLAFSSIDGTIGINDDDGNPIGSIGYTGIDAPGVVHQAAVDAVEADLQSAYDLIASGDSANALAISAAVDDYILKYGEVDAKIDDAVLDFTAGLATKSRYTISTSAPTTDTVGNAGDVHERYQVVSVEGDGTPVSPPENRVIGRWRCAGGTGTPAVAPYTWTPMDLDAVFIPKLDLATGTFGDLDGVRLVARTVGAQHMIVTDWTNLLPDIEEWIGAATDTTGPYLPVQGNGSSNTHFVPKGGSPSYPVTPGDVFRFEWDVYANYAGFTGGAYGYFRFLAGDKTTLVGSPTAVSVAFVPQGSGQTNPYATFSGEVTVPDGCYWLNFLPYMTPNGKAAIRRMSLRKKYGGSLLVDGSVLTNHLGANVVGTKNLIVSDFTNYIANPGAEDDSIAPHIANSGTWTAHAFARSGTRSFRGVLPTQPGAAYNIIFNGPRLDKAQKLPVVPGDVVRAEAWVLIGAVTGATKAHLYLDLLRSDGTVTNTVGGTLGKDKDGVQEVTNVTLTTGWKKIVCEYTIPTATPAVTHIGLAVAASAATAGDVLFVDDVSLRKKYGGEVIIDGSLRTRHLNAEFVNGLIVTGSAIQTSDQGAPSTWIGGNLPKGIKITDTGFVAYSSGVGAGAAPLGTSVTSINANTGRMSAVGGFATATGYDDISITPGDIGIPAAMKFISDGTGIDNIFPASLSMADGEYTNLGTATWSSTMTLQGAKYGTAGVGGVPRARIDIWSQRSKANSGITKSDIHYHAGSSGGWDGTHGFWINGVDVGQWNNLGIILGGGRGLAIGQFQNTVPSDGIFTLGVIKSSAAVHADTGFYDLGLAGQTQTAASISNTGRIIRTPPSAGKYKENVVSIELDTAKRFLDFDGVTFTYIPDMVPDAPTDTQVGFISDHLHDADLTPWVQYEAPGVPGGVNYDRVVAILPVLFRDVYARLEALEGA